MKSGKSITDLDERQVSERSTSADEAATLVSLRQVRYSYDDSAKVLDDLDLDIAQGEILGVIGPSGCGKSTLLRLIADFIKPRSGIVERHLDDTGQGCPIAMMFQTNTTFPWLTVEENVLLFARFKKWRHSLDSQNLSDHAAKMLQLVHLDESAQMYPYQLSGGMLRRLAFATAVAPLPKLLLLDEPFSSVDEPTRVRIHQDVYDIVRRLKLTAVLVTHDLAEALSLCDRILLLSRRPAYVRNEYPVSFSRERDILALRNEPRFLDLYGEIWNDLSAEL